LEHAAMRVTLKIEESAQGLWRVCRDPSVVYDGLRFAAAIRLAHGLAREEHNHSGSPVDVQMVCDDFTMTRGEYAGTLSGHLAA
jgi:hypothetical protein